MSVSGTIVNQLQNLATIAADSTSELASNAVKATTNFAAGLHEHENAIAMHFIRKKKYGLARDGTKWENFKMYQSNHHVLLSCFYAHKRNPFSAHKKRTVLLATTLLAFSLAATITISAAQIPNVNDSKTTLYVYLCLMGILSSAITRPCEFLMVASAQNELAIRCNACIKFGAYCGETCFYITLILCMTFSIAGILSFALYFGSDSAGLHCIASFTLNLASHWLSDLTFPGSISWLVHSWNGVLCCPRIRETDLVCCPLLSTCPFSLVLAALGLGEPTFDDDRAEFEKAFPGRTCIFLEEEALTEGELNAPLLQ